MMSSVGSNIDGDIVLMSINLGFLSESQSWYLYLMIFYQIPRFYQGVQNPNDLRILILMLDSIPPAIIKFLDPLMASADGLRVENFDSKCIQGIIGHDRLDATIVNGQSRLAKIQTEGYRTRCRESS